MPVSVSVPDDELSDRRRPRTFSTLGDGGDGEGGGLW